MVSVAVLHMGYAEIVFIQPGTKLTHVTRCLAKTSYPTSKWDVAIANDHSSSMALPLSRPETQKLAAWEPAVQWAKHFFYRIARIWIRLTCHPGCSSANGLPSSKFLLSWQNENNDCQKHGRNYHMAQSLPIHHFHHLFYLRLMLFARWRHFPRLIQIKFMAWYSEWRDRDFCQIW